MRNLTIKRTKCFVACLAKMKVYIEDNANGEILINNVPCRKIGELKNGEEKTFEVEESAAKVFVIADKLSKEFCNEFYQLPEGSEDICLTGKNKYNLASANAFRFDNNESGEALYNRKYGKRKGLVVVIASLLVGIIIGLVSSSLLFPDTEVKNKKFSTKGITITLTNEFQKVKDKRFVAAYGTEEVSVFILKEEFSISQGFEDYTLEQYAEMMIEANGLTTAELGYKDELTYFTYNAENTETDKNIVYYSYVYKSDNAFWAVQFAVEDKNVEKYEKQIFKWAKTVKFK